MVCVPVRRDNPRAFTTDARRPLQRRRMVCGKMNACSVKYISFLILLCWKLWIINRTTQLEQSELGPHSLLKPTSVNKPYNPLIL